MSRKNIVKFAILLSMLGLIVFSKASAAAAVNALHVCAQSVIPSLFPFFVLSKLLLSGGFPVKVPFRLAEKCFGVSEGCLSAFFISILGGYPAGAAAVTELYQSGEITKRDAERALCFCNNSGPAFFLAFIGGGILQSATLGVQLYLIHILSALLCGRLLAEQGHTGFQMRMLRTEKTANEKSLPAAIAESCTSLLQISGQIVFFSVIISIVEEVGLFRLLAQVPFLPLTELKPLLCGVFELSSGILLSAGSRYAFLLCAFLMGWGGFCVHMQAKSIWSAAGLRPKRYYYAKLLHGLISAIFAFACMSPSILSVSVCCAVMLLCALFPAISKNGGRNLSRNTL